MLICRLALTVPADVEKRIRDKSGAWLKQQYADIDNNPENPAVGETSKYSPAEWAEVSASSKAYREAQAKSQIKELLGKWPKEKAQKSRSERERAKKKDVLRDMRKRSDNERKQKDIINKTERAAKALNAKITNDLTKKERANKPSRSVQDELDEKDTAKKNETRYKEAKEKYKILDAEQKAAEAAEIKREKAELEERKVKQAKLEADAKKTGVTLAESLESQRRQMLDVLAKDAYIASLKDSNGHTKSSNEERNIAVSLEERAQNTRKQIQMPAMKPGALAEVGEAASAAGRL